MLSKEFIIEVKPNRSYMSGGPMDSAATTRWTAIEVIQDILDNLATTNENPKPGQYLVCRPWVNNMSNGMFSTMDCEPGEGGSIGVKNIHGNTAEDIATAAHEAYHAYLHKNGQDYHNEQAVNAHAEKWVDANLTGGFKKEVQAHLLRSRNHYDVIER